MKSDDFQSNFVLLITENRLSLTAEVTVDVVHKCLQHIRLLALYFEIFGYIPRLLNGFRYLRRISDFRGGSLKP